MMLEKRQYCLNLTVQPFMPKGIKIRRRSTFKEESIPQNIKSISIEWTQAHTNVKALKKKTTLALSHNSTKINKNRCSILRDNEEQEEKECNRKMNLKIERQTNSNETTQKAITCDANKIRVDVLDKLIKQHSKDLCKDEKIEEIKNES